MDDASPPDWPRSLPAPVLPGGTPVQATPLPGAHWLHFNAALGARLGLSVAWSRQPQALAVLSGAARWPGHTPDAGPYAGHQFGRWVPQLGDGRVLRLARLAAGNGPALELQLKGAGPTPWARGGDGRCTLASALRELLGCEALHALGVPTARALALVGGSAQIEREDQRQPAAVLARCAPGFLRFGHLQWLAAQGAPGRLQTVVDAWIATHHPQLDPADPARHARWLGEVIAAHAALHAQWQSLGFSHGVLNTDNCSLLGLTLDLGPFDFMERFSSLHVANGSDSEGRYAWSAQPAVGQWNVERLLDACAPLLPSPEERQRLAALYAQAYQRAVMQRWRAKLGLLSARDGDAALLNRLLTLMQQGRCDHTLTWRALAWVAEPGRHGTAAPEGGERQGLALRQRFAEPAAFDAWAADYHARLAAEGQTQRADHRARAKRMRRTNPLFVLRRHQAQRVIDAALQGDLHPLQTALRVLSRPFEAQPGMDDWARPAPAGTPLPELSCSS